MADGDESLGRSIDGDAFQVLVNGEGQHSLWPAFKAAPAGWSRADFAGSKAACLDYVDRSWRDLRRLSLQARLDQADP